MDENPYKAPADLSVAKQGKPDDRLDVIEWAAVWLPWIAIAQIIITALVVGCLPI